MSRSKVMNKEYERRQFVAQRWRQALSDPWCAVGSWWFLLKWACRLCAGEDRPQELPH